jgi:hypothetical protein
MRYGKPIKNKKHRDPRYFLSESTGGITEVTAALEGLKKLKDKVCTYKTPILWAIDKGSAVGLAQKFSEDGAAAIRVIDEWLRPLDTDLETLSQTQGFKIAAKTAIGATCMGAGKPWRDWPPI